MLLQRELDVVELPRKPDTNGFYSFRVSSNAKTNGLFWQHWRRSSIFEKDLQSSTEEVRIRPYEGFSIFFFFVSLEYAERVNWKDSDEVYCAPSASYQSIQFCEGEWVNFQHSLRPHSWEQWSLSIERLELLSEPKGVLSVQALIDCYTGKRSATELILLDWRLRMQPKLKEALEVTQRMKHAFGKSSTAGTVQKLLEEILHG